jgi:hypothetical protein
VASRALREIGRSTSNIERRSSGRACSVPEIRSERGMVEYSGAGIFSVESVQAEFFAERMS